jgi:hypothetical protein
MAGRPASTPSASSTSSRPRRPRSRRRGGADGDRLAPRTPTTTPRVWPAPLSSAAGFL